MKNLFFALTFALSPMAAFAGSCSECANGCKCESTSQCTCDKDACDCNKCSEKN